MSNNTFKIVHLYPDLLNLYGDKGNIMCLKKRLEWRGFDVCVTEHTSNTDKIDLTDADIVFLGGGADREEKIVCKKLIENRNEFKNYVESDGVILAVCGGYPMLGKYYELENEKHEGLGILDITTKQGKDRLISDVIIKCDALDTKIVGFENHSSRTDIGNHTPLGSVEYGFGNDESSGYEGVIYKNVVASYLHGPILPKNPKLCDYIIERAIKRKIPEFKNLEMLDDTLEVTANEYMVKRFKK